MGSTDTIGIALRAVEKINYPNLLVFCSIFGVVSTCTYPDMRRQIRLEDESTSGAIWDNLLFPRP
jgi:hypothetical protein